MNKVLIAVDSTKSSMSVLGVFRNLVRPPKEVLLLHVKRLEGRSLMIDMLGEAELSTLKESLKGTEYKEKLDRAGEMVLENYRKELEAIGLFSVRTLIREGMPADEILKLAEEEKVDLIVIGSSGKKGMDRLITGCVIRDVERHAAVPVIVGKVKPAEVSLGLEVPVTPQFS
jgi:nucleotide-binding universal stress UspA family protein